MRRGRSGGRREQLGMARVEACHRLHVLAAVVADHLEHALHGRYHVAEGGDAVRALGRGEAGELFEQILHDECHGRDHRISMKGSRPLQSVGDHHKWVDHP